MLGIREDRSGEKRRKIEMTHFLLIPAADISGDQGGQGGEEG